MYGCDTTNIVFLRPGSVAVTVTYTTAHSCITLSVPDVAAFGYDAVTIMLLQITPYCWDNSADFDQLGDAVGEGNVCCCLCIIVMYDVCMRCISVTRDICMRCRCVICCAFHRCLAF